ncbi:MAG TPA: autotransporter assembly complex family protein [Moraxellaceae bacterium]|nr:autotransporter assembly complex family protein [Moraxellaceae bacterium]
MTRRGGGFGWRGVGALLCLLGALAGPAAADSDVDVEVRGVSGALLDNVRAYVGRVGSDDLASWRNTRTRLYATVQEALRALGYYRPNVDISNDGSVVTIRIAPGAPVTVRTLRLDIRGEAASDPAFAALREKLPLRQGDPLHHGRYEALKTAVRNLGVERGYFDADWETHSVEVDPAANAADIVLVYASGPRFRFGPVSFRKTTGEPADVLLRPALMRRFLTFDEGDPYDAGALIKFNRALLDSRFFSEVRVHAERERAVDGAVPIEVVLAADKPNNVDIGVGYSTDVKERLTLKWQRPLINDRGHGIEIGTELSPVRSSLDAKYTVPLTHPLHDTLQYLYGVRREDVQEVVTWNTVLGVQRQIKKESGWQRTYSLRALRDTTETPLETVKKDLVLPGISFDRLRTRGGIDPDWGDRQFYQFEAASEQVLSDASLVSVRTGLRLLRTLAGRHQFLVRADAGAILTDDFDDVPQSMRFFAGGDQSIRGYAYKSVSPRDENGLAVGARNLLTGTLEYDYEFVPRWRLAVFTDAGNAFDSPNESVKVGSGVGIRWVSPVGPIRLDVAWPVSEVEKNLRIHFSMGPNL